MKCQQLINLYNILEQKTQTIYLSIDIKRFIHHSEETGQIQ